MRLLCMPTPAVISPPCTGIVVGSREDMLHVGSSDERPNGMVHAPLGFCMLIRPRNGQMGWFMPLPAAVCRYVRCAARQDGSCTSKMLHVGVSDELLDDRKAGWSMHLCAGCISTHVPAAVCLADWIVYWRWSCHEKWS